MKPDETPAFDSMTKKEYSLHEWLLYFKNDWNRSAIACTVDLQHDLNMIAAGHADDLCPPDPRTGIQMTFRERAEVSKEKVQHCLDMIKAETDLLSISPELFVSEKWSEKALAPTPAPKSGDVCQTTDGKEGVLATDGKGGLICQLPLVPVEPKA